MGMGGSSAKAREAQAVVVTDGNLQPTLQLGSRGSPFQTGILVLYYT